MTAEPLSLARLSWSRRKSVWIAAALLLAALLAGAVSWLNRPGSPGGTPSIDAPPSEPGDEVTGPPWFQDRTATSGLDFTHRNGEEANHYTILESLGGGVALLDYDGDGRLDIFLTGGGFFTGPDLKQLGGHPCKLYRNQGGWKFQDVTRDVGLDLPWWYNHGVAVADYDRDGWPDLVVTGYGKLALFHNETDGKGGRRFVDVTDKVGLRDDSWSTSAGWADLDGDGFPDLYVCHYLDWSFRNHPECPGLMPTVKREVCPPQKFKPLVHALFHNDRGKGFRNVSADHGFKALGCGLGVLLADFNDDGRPDIYVANDASNNFLFMNRGGKLEEKGLLAGVAVDDNGHYNGSMGVDASDYDGSGRPSIWVTNFQGETHALYYNLGQERFDHQSRRAGVGSIGMHWVGFGTGFLDADNDGWEDLVIANGHVLRRPVLGSTLKQRPILMRNVAYQGRRFFRDVSRQGGAFFQTPTIGRGLAIGDLDNDGWPDLVASPINSPVELLRNEAGSNAAAQWLGLKLVGRDHRDVAGSTVILEGPARRLTRFVKGGGSYLSASDPRLLFGLGQGQKEMRITVKWAWGREQTWNDLQPGRYWELREGEARAVTSP